MIAFAGPINNRSLFVQRGSSVTLRPNTDHFKLNEDIWSLFLSLYSGGPEVVLRPGGGIKVNKLYNFYAAWRLVI